MANARLEWTPSGGSRQSYTLPVNFTWDYQELAQDETDRERALDGTLRSYLRGLKQRWVLRFQYHLHGPEGRPGGHQAGPGGY